MERVTNFRELLSGPISKKVVDTIVESVLFHPEDFEIIYNLTKDPEKKVFWRSFWVCEKLSELYPDLFFDKTEELITTMLNCKHDGSKRLLLSILYNLPVPDPLPVHLLDFCFSHMFDVNESIAVQALSIKMAHRLCLIEPELLPELRLYLENAELEYYSAGVKSVARNVLRKLN